MDMEQRQIQDGSGKAIVIGAGLGGLASAMRLGAKGWRVTVIDRLDRVGGRGSSITQGGHRFDLGPTIVTVPQGLRDLWAACGRDFDRDVRLVPMEPFYDRLRLPKGPSFGMTTTLMGLQTSLPGCRGSGPRSCT